MAKVTETNPHLNTHAKRDAATGRFVIESTAIEGVHFKKKDLAAPKACAREPRKPKN